MNAPELIARLGLTPHPEGGHYREIHRSAASVDPLDGRPLHSALTTIYFLLARGERSRWHRVRSDEVWHHYAGGALELLMAPPSLDRIERVQLGGGNAGESWVHTVPAGWWQAARPLGDFTLSGCTVGPGFEFADFAFLRDETVAAATLLRLDPALASLV